MVAEIDFQPYLQSRHWFRLMGYIVRNAHSAGIAAILEVSRQNPYFEGILSIFPITRNQCPPLDISRNPIAEQLRVNQ
jgi:hypothetical protein